jgi:transposase
MRARTPARAHTLRALTDAPCRLQAFLRRHASRSTGRAHGGPAPLRGLAAVGCPTPAPHIVLQAAVRAVHEHTARRQRLAPALPEPVQVWRLSPVVAAWPALRGVPGTGAVTLVAAMGALSRCETPRARRTFWGLMPSAYAPGARRRQGAMTQAGPTQARQALVAGAGAYRSPAQLRRHLPWRLAKQPQRIQDIRWPAQVRRCQRDRQLVARGKQAPVVTGAMARERAGGMGAMAQEMPLTASGQKTDAPFTPHAEGLPTCRGRGAASVWCHPRRR